jgi:hypothetical protein
MAIEMCPQKLYLYAERLSNATAPWVGGAKCSTSRFATILAIISSALWTTLAAGIRGRERQRGFLSNGVVDG